METTNFFSSVAALKITGDLQLIIRKGAENNWIVSVISQGGASAFLSRRRKAVARRSGAATYPKPVPVHFFPGNPFCATGCGTNYYVIVVAFNHF